MRHLLIPFLLLAAPALSAQTPEIPVITTHGEGVTEITPDRAVIRFAVETTAPTAREAGADNARIATRVTSAILAQGVQASRITTVGYTLAPEYRYRPNQAPLVTGYRAANTIVVNVDVIRQVGPVIDTALSSGANRVDDLAWQTADPSAGRLEAISKAVTQARREADAAAAASGSHVAGVASIEIDAAPTWSPRPMMAMAASVNGADARTPVEPGTGQVRVSVSVRWRVQ